MQVEFTTLYTEEAILKAMRFSIDKKKRMGIFLTICTSIVALCCLFLVLTGEADGTVWFCFGSVIFLDLFFMFLYVFYPRIVMKKAKNKDLSITYTFGEDQINIVAKNDFYDENSTVKYSVMSKVHKKGSDLYIFDSVKRVYYVDLSGAESKDIVILKELIERNFDNKKIIWE